MIWYFFNSNKYTNEHNLRLFLLGALSLARLWFGFAPEDAQAHHLLFEVLVLVPEEAVVPQAHHQLPGLDVPRVVRSVLRVFVARQRQCTTVHSSACKHAMRSNA